MEVVREGSSEGSTSSSSSSSVPSATPTPTPTTAPLFVPAARPGASREGETLKALYGDSALGKSLASALASLKGRGALTAALEAQTQGRLTGALQRQIFDKLPADEAISFTGQVASFNLCQELANYNMTSVQVRGLAANAVSAQHVTLFAVELEEGE